VLPSKQAVIERYAERTGFDVEALAWYHAFAVWKIAIIKQQLYNRYLRGESNDARLRKFGRGITESAEQARELLRDGT
jgi:aminoglycoside phosphotransferase (APT) family kinase protein